MSDPKVKQVQDWLLETYGNRSEFSNFVTSSGFQANGNTGNNTMTALVFALQYELGISQPSGNFGPTTINLSPKISLATAANYSKNIIKILEGGLWCHGYSAGYSEPEIPLFGGVEFGGTYDEDTDKAVKQLQKDIGISQSGRFDGYLWKALLSTDAFVTTWTNGSAKIREAQQYLNALAINGYYFADDFIGGYLPTDGLNNRAFSKALILYIQAIQGIYASEATGNLGPSTQANLVNIPDGLPSDTTKSRHFVRAAVFALLANGYDLTINSYWSDETSSVVSQFQKDMALPVTGKIDLTTWMSLLVSHGNPNRPFSIIDTRFEITEERLAVIKNMGIKAVGRYINGTEFKVLRKKEYNRLIDNGIGLIPIYQQNALSSDDFSYSDGAEQGRNAENFARSFGIPYNSIIYFAVDYDAQDWEITNYIIPYFRGVVSMCKDYQVGVYGTRNVCQRLADIGLTVSSYVSNMSSGFSGNLGFKMPSNWTYDQFNETKISDFDIDKVGYSGRHTFVTSYVDNSTDPEIISDSENLSMGKRLAEKTLSTLGIVGDNLGFLTQYRLGTYLPIFSSPTLFINYAIDVSSKLSTGSNNIVTIEVDYESKVDPNGNVTSELSMQSKSKIKDLIDKINDSIEGELTQNVLNQFNVLAKNAKFGEIRFRINDVNANYFSMTLYMVNCVETTVIDGLSFEQEFTQELNVIVTFPKFNPGHVLVEDIQFALNKGLVASAGLSLIGSMKSYIENENESDVYGKVATVLGIAVGIIIAAVLLKVMFGLIAPTLITFGGKTVVIDLFSFVMAWFSNNNVSPLDFVLPN